MSESSRLVHISISPIPSTQANSVHAMCMAGASAREGYRTTLIARRSRELPGVTDDFAYYGAEPDFEILKLPRIRGLNFLYSRRAARRAGELKPDALYGRDLLGVCLASGSGVPTVLECHTPLAGFASRRILARLVRRDNLKRIVVISRALKKLMLEAHRGLLREELVTVAPDGVDLERFAAMPGREEARASLDLPGDRFIAGYFGHLYAGRGVELVLSMARRLPEILFLLVGGRPADVARLRAAADGLENVKLPGHVARGELLPYWSTCDTLLMPYQREVAVSGGGDTAAWMSPMKMFEYMAAERPIVSSDLPVLREVLAHEENALMVKPDSVEAWTEAVARLRDDSDFAKRLAARAREDVEACSWRARARRVMEGVL